LRRLPTGRGSASPAPKKATGPAQFSSTVVNMLNTPKWASSSEVHLWNLFETIHLPSHDLEYERRPYARCPIFIDLKKSFERAMMTAQYVPISGLFRPRRRWAALSLLKLAFAQVLATIEAEVSFCEPAFQGLGASSCDIGGGIFGQSKFPASPTRGAIRNSVSMVR